MNFTKLLFYLTVFATLLIMSYFLSNCSSDDDDVVLVGPISFDLLGGGILNPASGEGISDGTFNVPLNPVFVWRASEVYNGNTVVYDVYLDTIKDPIRIIAPNIPDTTHMVEEALQPATKYYYKIVAKDSGNGLTHSSDTWSFLTLFPSFPF